jgi:hypothetical protein
VLVVIFVQAQNVVEGDDALKIAGHNAVGCETKQEGSTRQMQPDVT